MKGVSCQEGYRTSKLPQRLNFLSLQGTSLRESPVEFYGSFMPLLSCRESSSAPVMSAAQNLSYLAHMGGWGEGCVKYAFTTNSNILCFNVILGTRCHLIRGITDVRNQSQSRNAFWWGLSSDFYFQRCFESNSNFWSIGATQHRNLLTLKNPGQQMAWCHKWGDFNTEKDVSSCMPALWRT